VVESGGPQVLKGLEQRLLETVLGYINAVAQSMEKNADKLTVKFWRALLSKAYDMLDKVGFHFSPSHSHSSIGLSIVLTFSENQLLVLWNLSVVLFSISLISALIFITSSICFGFTSLFFFLFS